MLTRFPITSHRLKAIRGKACLFTLKNADADKLQEIGQLEISGPDDNGFYMVTAIFKRGHLTQKRELSQSEVLGIHDARSHSFECVCTSPISLSWPRERSLVFY